MIRTVGITLCMLGAAIAGLLAGLIWSPPIKSETAVQAHLDSLEQCRADREQLTDWKGKQEAIPLITLLSRLEEAIASKVRNPRPHGTSERADHG